MAIKYLGLDFENNLLKYIIKIDEIIYYSNVNFNQISCSINLNDYNVVEELINSSALSYEDDLDKYKSLEKSSYSAYICFDILQQNQPYENYNNYSVSSYTLTGNSDDVLKGENIVGVIFEKSLLVTTGLHYGKSYDDEGKLHYIYIIDTEYDSFWSKYIAKIKIWEIYYCSTSPLTSSTNKIVEVDIKTKDDILIVGDSNSGEISFASEGSAYIPIKNISFDFNSTNFSYISKYRMGYTTEKEASNPTYLTTADHLLGIFFPYYE